MPVTFLQEPLAAFIRGGPESSVAIVVIACGQFRRRTPAQVVKPGELAKPALGTTRGGNWRTAAQEELLASARMPVPPETRRNTIGFRVVLARGK